MFTGIIKNTARIISIDRKKNFCTYIISIPNNMLDGLEIGSSIANNGCCLTVTKINDNQISFDLVKETLYITNLGTLVPGDIINIERATKFGDEIGGHLMSGHIITTAEIKKIIILDKNWQIWFELKDLTLMKYFIYKGFVGINGISLTIGELTKTCFCVNLIPETLKRTTLGMSKLGQCVNVEIDTQIQILVNTIERVFNKEKS